MWKPFQSVRRFFERMAFAGLKPDEPAGPKKSKLSALIQSAEDLATRGLDADQPAMPGPVSTRRKVLLTASGVVLAGIAVALVITLRQPAHKPEAQVVNAPPAPLLKPGIVVEKNRDLSV